MYMVLSNSHHFYIHILQSFSFSSTSSKKPSLTTTSPDDVFLTLKLTISYLWVPLSTIALFFVLLSTLPLYPLTPQVE